MCICQSQETANCDCGGSLFGAHVHVSCALSVVTLEKHSKHRNAFNAFIWMCLTNVDYNKFLLLVFFSSICISTWSHTRTWPLRRLSSLTLILEYVLIVFGRKLLTLYALLDKYNLFTKRNSVIFDCSLFYVCCIHFTLPGFVLSLNEQFHTNYICV